MNVDDASTPTTATYRRSLSPSRAGDFTTCPLLFRFRVIDRLPEPADPVMVRGTLVHAVLENLFLHDSGARTLEAAAAMIPEQWEQLRATDERLSELFTAQQAAEQAQWLASCRDLLATYFSMEDPRYLEPAAREERVAFTDDNGVSFGGIIDRVDIAPDGRIRIVDYKTGKSPNPRYQDQALFQMKFYALVVWRTRGVIPTLLQLMYLGDGQFLRYEPTTSDLLATERKLAALWQAIETAIEQRNFPPRRSGLCNWCAHKALCPEFGGTPPQLPVLIPAPEA